MARLFFSAQRIRAGAGVPDRGGAWAGGCAGAMRAVRRADAALQAHGGSMAIAFDALDGLCGTCEATSRPARRRRRNRARSSTGHAVRIARADVRKLLARGDACAETRVDDRTDDCIEDHVRAPHRRSRGTISRGVRSARRRRRAGVVGSSYRSGTGRSQKNFPGVHSALGTAGASDARRGRVRTQACFIRRDIGDDA